MKKTTRSLLVCLALLVAAPGLAEQPAPALVPWPRSLELKSGELEIGPGTRIAAAAPALEPLARVLADEMQAIVGLRPQVVAGPGAPGDIVLVEDAALEGEAHAVDVADRATVRGGTYGGVALGTVTLLQALRPRDGKAALPRMAVADEPAVEFRGLMMDVARKYHSIASLRQMIQLCRLYKIRYLQLHLTDDQSFMFPSKAYPLLATKNDHGGKTYTLEELEDLVAYADARNVTIIPEYEVPGHSGAANRTMPDLFKIRDTTPYEHHASINFPKDDVMRAVDTIIGEMCDVFRSTPYFHIGGDEADLALADQNVEFQAAFKKTGLPNQHQLYRKFVVDVNEMVKKRGKRTIVWEGFGREPDSPVKIPKDIIVMEYEVRFYRPDHLLEDGYTVINASWVPLYVVNATCRPPEEIYKWNVRQFKPHGTKPEDPGVVVPPDGTVFGAQMCAWEQPEAAELPSLRHRVPAMAERIWNPDAGKDFADFARRQAATDGLLEKLVQP